MKSSAVCLRDGGRGENIRPFFHSLTFTSIFPVFSPFTGEGRVTRDRLGGHVVVRVRAVEEGLPSLALEGGVQGEARALRAQRGVAWREAIFGFVAAA